MNRSKRIDATMINLIVLTAAINNELKMPLNNSYERNNIPNGNGKVQNFPKGLYRTREI